MPQSMLAEFDGNVIIPAQPLNYPPGQRLRIIEPAAAEVANVEETLPPELERREDGTIVVRGRRISLHLIVEALDQGANQTEIHERFPGIAEDSLARILDCCREHPELVRRYYEQQESLSKRLCDPAHRGPSLDELRTRGNIAKPT